MLIIEDILISDDLIQEAFVCNLKACKGACCQEGDYGAPLEEAEMTVLQQIYADVAPFLTPAGRAAIEAQGVYTWFDGPDDYGTPLIDGGPCAYMTRDALGIAQCGIELAWRAGATDFRKPISCHLYPVRITPRGDQQMEIINYERWDICSAACTLGAELQMPVYQFVREALIRKYGEAFYEALHATAQHLKSTAS
ncbi:MAG TPA: DUF3109 family protein [Saprospiraceae bacterium]|nr:DUF3109 family protein [Saprospiraceae bacterium]HMP26014.1 DUF3109 family protein [Saprospiraceae bacterium]